jgi:pyridoxal phosphate enzyme (YggS family)
MTPIAENLRDIQERIARAAEKSGRRAAEIRLVAVSKGQPVEAVREAVAAGVRELGENYVQEAEEKLGLLGPEWAAMRAPVTRHFLGHLQRNKAGKAAALFDWVQSVDSLELAGALGRRAAALQREVETLVEVNISGEPSKAGASPEAALDLAGAVAGTPGIRLRGLMGIGPLGGDEEATRRCFRLLARLFEQLPAENRNVLSMGMTGDFELAVAEGSTMVRIGTGIFGARKI